MGNVTEPALGKKKNSLFINLTKSVIICNQPFLPAILGPKRRCICANNFLSVRTTNKQSNIIVKLIIKYNSDKLDLIVSITLNFLHIF